MKRLTRLKHKLDRLLKRAEVFGVRNRTMNRLQQKVKAAQEKQDDR